MPTLRNNDAALVAQAQMGDEDAFTTLYNQHSQNVYRFALRLTGDHQEAEDVLQDAFLKAFVHLGEFRNEARFSTWLISIAGNEAFSRLRRLPLQKQIPLDPGAEFDGKPERLRDIQDYQDNAEETCRRLESQTILSNVMRKLTPSMDGAGSPLRTGPVDRGDGEAAWRIDTGRKDSAVAGPLGGAQSVESVLRCWPKVRASLGLLSLPIMPSFAKRSIGGVGYE